MAQDCQQCSAACTVALDRVICSACFATQLALSICPCCWGVCRMTALDIIQHEFVSLSEETNSFPVADELSQLLRQLYGSAAAALAMIAEQVRCRQQLTAVCAANQHILKVSALCCAVLCCAVLCCAVLIWHQAGQQLTWPPMLLGQNRSTRKSARITPAFTAECVLAVRCWSRSTPAGVQPDCSCFSCWREH
jgi:hypothetical protein